MKRSDKLDRYQWYCNLIISEYRCGYMPYMVHTVVLGSFSYLCAWGYLTLVRSHTV